MECSVIHHVVIVLLLLWVLSYFYVLSLVYLYLVCCSFSGEMFLLDVKASIFIGFGEKYCFGGFLLGSWTLCDEIEEEIAVWREEAS